MNTQRSRVQREQWNRQLSKRLRELQRQNDELTSANRAKDAFLSTLARELRTPLTAIIGWAHLLRSGTLNSSKVLRAWGTVERNAAIQAQLLSNTTDLSRIVSGTFNLNFQVVNWKSLLDSALDEIAPLACASSVQLDSSVVGRTANSWGDPERLRLVIWNLLANAIKLTPAGGRISVVLESRESMTTLRVSYSGVGVNPNQVPSVADCFGKDPGANSLNQGGLILGLALARHITELHGGTARAQSGEAERLSQFSVEFPRLAAPNISAPVGLGASRPRAEKPRVAVRSSQSQAAKRARDFG